jgi:hypothetical protein
MAIQEFTKKAIEVKWRRYFYAFIISLFIFLVFDSYPLIQQKNWIGLVKSVLLFVIVPIVLYRFLKRIEKGSLIWKTFKIKITDDAIIREFGDQPPKEILKSEIKTLIREEDGIRINGDDGIWIPDSINDFNTIEKILIKHSPSLDSNGNIIKGPEEQAITHIEVFQKYFPVVSLLTLVIIICSYIKLYHYYDLYDIEIYSYLDASEVILYFISLWKEFVVLLLMFGSFHNISSWIRIRRSNSKLGLAPFFQYAFMVIPMVGLYIFSLDSLGRQEIHTNILIGQINALFSCFFSAWGIVIILYGVSNHFMPRERLVTIPLTFFAIIFAFFLITYAENKISHDLIVQGHPKYSLNLILSDGSNIKTNDSTVFVGSTNSYLYFRKIQLGSNLIIPRSMVVKEEIRLLRIGL